MLRANATHLGFSEHYLSNDALSIGKWIKAIFSTKKSSKRVTSSRPDECIGIEALEVLIYMHQSPLKLFKIYFDHLDIKKKSSKVQLPVLALARRENVLPGSNFGSCKFVLWQGGKMFCQIQIF
jgi:hypothetical protein